MTTLTGHLTTKDKKSIKAIIALGFTSGIVGKVSYFLTIKENIYTVKMLTKDRGLIPVLGSKLRISTYVASFTL